MEAPESDAAFLAKMETVIEHNSLGIAVAIGSRTGLLQTMIDLTEAKTSQEIAAGAGLNERLLIYILSLYL